MVFGLLLWGCGAPAEVAPDIETAASLHVALPIMSLPATANIQTHQALWDDVRAERHPSDGGGSLFLLSGPASIPVGEAGQWVFAYTSGDQGIAEGGLVVFQPPAFWGWDAPQVEHPQGPGFVELRKLPVGVSLEAISGDPQMMMWRVEGRALTAGETVQIHYGAGPAGARADRFSERESAFWVAVDGDGDGVRAMVQPPALIEITPGQAVRLNVTLPSSAAPGETVWVRVAALDGAGSGPVPGKRTLALTAKAQLGAPSTLTLDERGLAKFSITPTAPGVYALAVAGVGNLSAVSNPMVVREGAQPILWGDLQIHTGRSDGTGTPADVLAYARDVAGLDVVALTDHDHWGMQFMDQHPEIWQESLDAAQAFNVPGEFVAIPAYEWTNWAYGHRHVLFFGGTPTLYSAFDEATDAPQELWAALRGQPAVTIAHHSAGGPVAIDWTITPDPILEPVTEIVSVHGQSESPDAPGEIYQAVPGNFVVDQLRKGVRFGLIGSTDGHDGHPGLAHWNSQSGGLVAILSSDKTRMGVLEALRKRRVYATNGPRIVLRVTVNEADMGSVLGVEPAEVVVRVVGTTAIERLEWVNRAGSEVVAQGQGGVLLHHRFTVTPDAKGDFGYIRAIQADGGVAWSSPVYFETPQINEQPK
ncbi:MAG: DUF3604 domain-containing protein [Rhodobacterales bacterium]|nr:DUF3604 domain-containing protein [Rhodobacterales bacterium]